MDQTFNGKVVVQNLNGKPELVIDPNSTSTLVISNRFDSQVVTLGVTPETEESNPGNGILILSNRDGSRVITLGDSNSNGNVSMPNDCGAKRFFANDVFLTNSDCAEEFDLCGGSECAPGTVVVIDEQGAVRQSEQAYDRRVAGVISGAGDYKPGIVLDRRLSSAGRAPVALIGKVYCMVDAQYSPIEVGDLLTTSPTPGHAMRANDPIRAFGAVIGKALRRLKGGQALVPILIALQ